MRLTAAWSNGGSRWEKLQRIHVPALVVSLEELPLSAGVVEALDRAGLYASERLEGMSAAKLLALRGVGASKLLQLFGVIEAFETPAGAEKHAPSQSAIALLDALEAHVGDRDIPVKDVRFGRTIASLGTGARSLREVIAELRRGAERRSREDPWQEITPALAQLLSALQGVLGMTLEEEFEAIIHSLTGSASKMRMLAERLGAADGETRTLQVVGDAHGLTRERIRQIEARTQQKLVGRSVYAPRLEAALECARGLGAASAAELAEALLADGLARGRWQPSALISVACYFGIPHGLRLQMLNGCERLAGSEAHEVLAEWILRKAYATSRQEGAVQVKELAFQASERFKHWVSAREVRSILAISPDVRWLDANEGWVWFGPEQPNHRVLNYIRKMLSVAPRLLIDELYEGLLRSYRMDEIGVCPKPIVLLLCKEVSWIRVRQMSHVCVRGSLDRREVLGEVECTMVEVLLEAGNALDHYEFHRRCLARGIPHSTFAVYEGNSPVIRRMQPGIWQLRGLPVVLKQILLHVRRMRRRQVRLSIAASRLKQLPNENAFIRDFKLTSSQFRNYVLTIPEVTGLTPGTKLDVWLAEKPLGVIEIRERGRLKGLLALLKDAGAHVGERYRARFDVTLKTVRFERRVRLQVNPAQERPGALEDQTEEGEQAIAATMEALATPTDAQSDGQPQGAGRLNGTERSLD